MDLGNGSPDLGWGGDKWQRSMKKIMARQGSMNPDQNVQARSQELRAVLSGRPGAPSQHRNRAYYLVLRLSQKAKKQQSMMWSQRLRKPGAHSIYSCIYMLPGSKKNIRYLTRIPKAQANIKAR